MLDSDGQPVITGFNKKRNKEKALFGLKGLLSGMVADGTLDDQELLFLDIWLKSNSNLRDDEDVDYLAQSVSAMLDKPSATVNPSALLSHIDSVIRSISSVNNELESATNELLGLLDGVAANEQLHDKEVNELVYWLNKHPDVAAQWPGDVIADRLRRILADGIITTPERIEFIELIKQVTGTRLEETGQVTGSSTEFFEDEVSELLFDKKCFCFTGKFISGTRDYIEKLSTDRGASTSRSVTKKVDYLVIGIEASRDWKFASYGRKIEQAINLKRAGVPILILTERRWSELEKAAN